MKGLTPEQSRVLDCIIGHQKGTGAPPTVREIAAKLGYRSLNNVRQHLRLIQQKGYLRLHQGMARGIEILIGLTRGAEDGEVVEVPLVGAVAAGVPITAIENIDGYVSLDRKIFKGEGLFTLRVRGDSMQGIGVLDGDIVIVRQQATASQGDVVVAIIEGEATLKRYLREENRVILRAENPRFKDIVVESDRGLIIVGKMVGVMRKC
jgi:repressor LexA